MSVECDSILEVGQPVANISVGVVGGSIAPVNSPTRSPRLSSSSSSLALREIESPCDSGVSTPTTEVNSPLPGELDAKRLSKRKRSDEERKERHNNTERKGRQKINNEIAMLKELLPEIQNSAAPKASILQCAVDNLKRLQTLAYQLLNSNMQLKEENKKLWAEVNRLRSCLNPHDSFICDILDQKLVEDNVNNPSMNGITLPSPSPLTAMPSSSAPASMSIPTGQMYENVDGHQLPHSPPGSSSRGMSSYFPLPSLNPPRTMWCFS